MIYQVTRLVNKQLVTRLVSGIVLGLCLLMPAVVSAGGNDDDDAIPPSGRSTGSRGCGTTTVPSLSSVPALVLLAPSRRLGQTVSTRPTFAWFVRDAGSWSIEFRLYEHDLANRTFKLVKEIKDEGFKSSPGIMMLSLSEFNPELSTGKRYRWQVELVCNPSHPSSNLFAESEIEVVPIQPRLKTQLSGTPERLNRASIYAQANLWYDALGTVLTPVGDSTSMREFRFSLLDRVAVDDTERVALRNSAIYPITTLSQSALFRASFLPELRLPRSQDDCSVLCHAQEAKPFEQPVGL